MNDEQKRNENWMELFSLLSGHPEVDNDEIMRLAEIMPDREWSNIFELDKWLSENIRLTDGSVGLPSVFRTKDGKRIPDFWGTAAALKSIEEETGYVVPEEWFRQNEHLRPPGAVGR